MIRAPLFDHLVRMSTPLGTYEHAKGDQPRREHGFCLDDVARVLGVAARTEEPGDDIRALADTALAYVGGAAQADGSFVNRRAAAGAWTDRPALGDHWGRAVWGLAQVVGSPWCDGHMRGRALDLVERAMRARSPWLRATAYAAVGAADVDRALPGFRAARDQLVAARAQLARSSQQPGMVHWPEARLSYANALIPEAHLAIGAALDDGAEIAVGLRQLEWLVALQTQDGHLSPTPHGGWAPGEPLPGFDQQPIEVVALAEAAARAHDLNGDGRWGEVVGLAAAWFLGRNDVGVPLYDPRTGAGFDGLQRAGRNENQGAESTLAALATLHLTRRTAGVPT